MADCAMAERRRQTFCHVCNKDVYFFAQVPKDGTDKMAALFRILRVKGGRTAYLARKMPRRPRNC